MVGRQKARRSRGTGRRTISRSPAFDDTIPKPTQHMKNSINSTIVNNTPVSSIPLEPRLPTVPKTIPSEGPSSRGSSKRKFDDIAEVSWDSSDEKPLPEISYSANASIATVSERPSRRLRTTYTLAASIASVERITGPRSRRSGTRERSVTRNPLSSGFSKPNDSEKLVVKARDGRECWLCSQSNTVMLETAHNVVASNRDLFLNYRDTVGIFPPNLRHLASPHNLVTLCRNCHCVYDCQQPRWIILPTNLQYFIDYETEDYESRIKAASEGFVKPRSVPTALQYATDSSMNLYMPYFFEESVMPRMDSEEAASRFPRAYGGAPTTMILKAGLGINQPKIKRSKNTSLPFAPGIPTTVRQQVTTLFELWDRDPPSPRKRRGSAVSACAKEEDRPPGSEDDENSQNGTKKKKTRATPTSKKRKATPSQSLTGDHQDELADICAPTKKKARIAARKTAALNDSSLAPTAITKPDTMKFAGQDSQDSSIGRRYNLRSQLRTPPTSPEFTTGVPAQKTSASRRVAVVSKIAKWKRVSEDRVFKQSKKITKVTAVERLSKKDEKKVQFKPGSSRRKKTVAPLTPKSNPSPNDPISTNPIPGNVKGGIAKQALGESPIQQSIKRNPSLLFADVAALVSAEKATRAEGSEGHRKKTGKYIPRLTQRLPPAHFDESLLGEEKADFDSAASNIDSLDALSGGDDQECHDQHDDGYASDSGSERADKVDWSWGPRHTANDVIETCIGWFGVGTVGKIAG